MSNVLDPLPCTRELLWYKYEDALVNYQRTAVRDALFRHYERVAQEVRRVLLVPESCLTCQDVVFEKWSKVFIRANDIIIDLRLEDEVADRVDADIAAHLDASLHGQSTYKNEQA